MTRIGLMYPEADPISPANWSGTPRGLADGFTSLGIEVVPIPCKISQWVRLPLALLRRARGICPTVASRESVYVMARSINMASALRQAGHLDAIVAMGTDKYELPQVMQGVSIPLATYDDGTFSLFLRYEDSDLHIQGFPINAVRDWARRQADACRRASMACVSTNWAKRSVVEDFGVPDDRVCVVGMGHNPRSIPQEARNWVTPHFLFVGVEWKRKNGKAVVEAFGRVRERFPDATLDLVGEHPGVNAPGVRGHGFLPRENASAQERLNRLFAHATAFVLPSLFDPSPISYLEAASAGLPVIGTTYGGANELLGDAAICVDPHDRDALIRAMFHVCDMKVAQSMGTRALVKSAESTWRAVSGRIADNLLRVKAGK